MRFEGILLAFLLTSGAAAATPCPAGVAEFAPAALLADGRLQCVCERFSSGGRDLIAVAFSNGGAGRVAVLNERPALSVAARAPELLFDLAQSIELHDFDHDGHDELIFKYLNRNDVLWWVYAFDIAHGLRLLSPDGDDAPPIGNGELVDVNGDGMTDVLTASVVRDSTDADTLAWPLYDLYVWDGGTLRRAAAGTIAHYSVHLRGKGEPRNDVVDVHVPKVGRYTLKLLNGVLPKTTACTSGHVSLNERPVFTDSDFKKRAAVRTAMVDLQFDNTVEVRLGSTPDCAVVVIVENLQSSTP